MKFSNGCLWNFLFRLQGCSLLDKGDALNCTWLVIVWNFCGQNVVLSLNFINISGTSHRMSCLASCCSLGHCLVLHCFKRHVDPILSVHLRWISSHSWNHSQTIFSIEIWRQNHGCDYHLTDFFWKNMVASSFCHDRKSALKWTLSAAVPKKVRPKMCPMQVGHPLEKLSEFHNMRKIWWYCGVIMEKK